MRFALPCMRRPILRACKAARNAFDYHNQLIIDKCTHNDVYTFYVVCSCANDVPSRAPATVFFIAILFATKMAKDDWHIVSSSSRRLVIADVPSSQL